MTTYAHLVGKRVNVAGQLGTVEQVDGCVCLVRYDRWPLVPGKTLARVVDALPELVSRASFVHRPGDLRLRHDAQWAEVPRTALVRETPWGWRSGCSCDWVQDDGGVLGTKKAAMRAWYEHCSEAAGVAA